MDDKKKTFKKSTRPPNAYAQAGKLPPQALNLEEAVLGALMLDKDAVALIIDILRPASFYKEAHQHIYKAICNLFEKSHPIDLLTVTEELKTIGKLQMVGGPYQLVELTNRVASSANIEFHARIIAQKFIQRELIRTSTEVINSAFEDTIDVFDLLDSAEQNLFNITEQNLSRGSLGMSTLVNMAVKQLEEMSGKEEGLTGVPTGFVNLDKLTSGWQPSDLIIIAARPGMGKCLAKGTKVLLYDGRLREVERIQQGDQLMGDDSTPRRVLSIARGQEQMYWIHQDQAMSYRVNASHILSLYCVTPTEKYQRGAILNISVKDWLQRDKDFQACFQGYKVAVEFSQQPVLLPTYWVGLHLAPLLSEWQTVPETISSSRTRLEERIEAASFIPIAAILSAPETAAQSLLVGQRRGAFRITSGLGGCIGQLLGQRTTLGVGSQQCPTGQTTEICRGQFGLLDSTGTGGKQFPFDYGGQIGAYSQ